MRNINMTEGNIWKRMLMFAWPLLLGYILQQFYNTFDAVVVGKYVSSEALAAVGGTTGALVNMIVSFAIGLFSGANVLVSRFFGADDRKNLHDVVHTEIVIALIMGVILCVFGVFASPLMLRWMGTPAEVLPSAITYLRIYLVGLPAMLLYNAGSAILMAVGDSGKPLIFLIISTVINVVGDLIFVLKFNWGVAGVAWATVASQVVSVILMIRTLQRADGAHRFFFKDLRIHKELMKQIFSLGIPSGVQGTIVSFSNVVVQSYINGLGAISMAGYSAANKLDMFIQLPVQTMAVVAATFVGQNLGSRQVARARKGVRYAMSIAISVTILMSVLVLGFSGSLLRIFTSDADVLRDGAKFMWMFAPFYFILSGTQIIPGALRGAGDVRFCTYISVASFVVIRQIYLFIISRTNYSITTVAMCYPITWFLAASIICIYYLRSNWSKFEKQPENIIRLPE